MHIYVLKEEVSSHCLKISTKLSDPKICVFIGIDMYIYLQITQVSIDVYEKVKNVNINISIYDYYSISVHKERIE